MSRDCPQRCCFWRAREARRPHDHLAMACACLLRLLLAAVLLVAVWQVSGGALILRRALPDYAPYPTPLTTSFGSRWALLRSAHVALVGPGALGLSAEQRQLILDW